MLGLDFIEIDQEIQHYKVMHNLPSNLPQPQLALFILHLYPLFNAVITKNASSQTILYRQSLAVYQKITNFRLSGLTCRLVFVMAELVRRCWFGSDPSRCVFKALL